MNISTEELEEELLTLPSLIRTKTLNVFSKTKLVETQKELLEKIRHTELQPIIMKRNEMGKPIYPNVESREIVLEESLNINNDYINVRKALDSTSTSQKEEQIELEYLHNLFSAYKAIAGMRGVK